MKKKKLIISTSILAGLTIVSTSVVVAGCSKSESKIDINNYEHSSIWNLDDKKAIYLEKYNLTQNLDDIKIYDNSNNEIPFDKENSRISQNDLLINFFDDTNLPEEIKIENINTKEFVLLSNNDLKTFKKYNLLEDEKYFFELIKDMSSNKIPSIGLMRDASLIIQQAFYISLVNYFNNPNSKDDQTFLFGKSLLWDQKRFNAQALIDANVWNGNTNASEQQYQKFNLFQDNNIQNYKSEIINEFNQILINTNNQFFDYFQDENDFMIQLMNFNADYFNFLFKHANRIILMSDGAYHVNTTIPQLVYLLNNHKPRSRQETIKVLNDFRSGKIQSLTQKDVLDFMLLKNYESLNNNVDSKFNYISFINYDANIFNSISLNDNRKFNDSAFSTNFVDYKNCIDLVENQQKYLDVYSKLLVSKNLTKNDIFISGVNEYNPNKKNAIFIGSSLFKPMDGIVTPDNFSRLDSMPNVLNEIQNTFKEFLNKFNPDEYNIIFKLHPVFANKNDPENLGAKNYIKQITNGLITSPIIVTPEIPLETWIALDYYKFQNNPNNTNESIIFRQNNNINAKSWTTFFGFQATSTTIHTARLFYQNAFNLNKEEVAQLIPFSNFPIPKLFPVVDRLKADNDSYDYTEDNIKTINNIFKAFCPSIQYSFADNIENLKEFDSIVLNFGGTK